MHGALGVGVEGEGGMSRSLGEGRSLAEGD